MSLNSPRYKFNVTVLVACLFMACIAFLVIAAFAGGYSIKEIAIPSFALAFYFLLLAAGLSRTTFFSWLNGKSWTWVLGYLMVAAIGSVLVYLYIGQSHKILFWDNGMYWYSALEFNANLANGIRHSISSIYQSIEQSDYNLLPTLLISLPVMATSQYASFVTWNLVLFFCPLSLVATWLSSRVYCNGDMSDKSNDGFGIKLLRGRGETASLLYFFFFAPFVIPVLSGFIDISVLLVCTVLISICFEIDFFKRDFASSVLVGVLLSLSFLMRRYFVYLDLGIMSFFFILSVRRFLNNNASNRNKRITCFFTNAAIALLAMLGPLVTVFGGFLQRSLFNNYGDAYSAYVLYSSFGERVWSYLVNIGPVYALAAIGSIVMVVRHRGREGVSDYLALGVAFLVTLLSFLRTQDFSVQHYYVIDMYLYLMGCGFFYSLLEKGYKSSLQSKGLIVFSVVALATFAHMVGIAFPNEGIPALGTVWYQTSTRDDLNEIRRLDSDLEKLTASHGGSVYINASSNVLNSSIVMRSYAPESLYPPFALESTCDIDLRDGFPVGFLRARYVVVCDPVQTHVPNIETQSVVLEINSLISDRGGQIGKSYSLLDEYDLDNGVHAYLFELNGALSREQIEYVQSIFDSIYPGESELFHDRIGSYLVETSS